MLDRINTDEIVKEIGDWKDNSNQIKAGKIAINLRNDCFINDKSFNERIKNRVEKGGHNIEKELKENSWKKKLEKDNSKGLGRG